MAPPSSSSTPFDLNDRGPEDLLNLLFAMSPAMSIEQLQLDHEP